MFAIPENKNAIAQTYVHMQSELNMQLNILLKKLCERN